MSAAKRNADGTFPKGVSGNRMGRPPKKPPRHRLLAENRQTAFEIAEMSVEMTINGKVETVSGYRAVLLSLFKKAMEGHAPSIREYLRHMRECAAVNGQQTQFVQYLIEEHQKLEAELDGLRAITPEDPGHGVYIRYPDGGAIPGALHGKLERLKDLDKREAAITEREREIGRLEEAHKASGASP